jgi:hypothetical protein
MRACGPAKGREPAAFFMERCRGTRVALGPDVQTSMAERQAAPREPQVACIHLTGGSSQDSVWVLQEGVGGTFLTVGSDPECEWQIRAAGVPAHALSVLLIGGVVYMRSGPERRARMNGTLLNQDWTTVDADARVDVGLARLEIKLGKEALLPSLRDLHLPPEVQHEPGASHTPRSAASALERSGLRRSHASARHAPRSPSNALRERASRPSSSGIVPRKATSFAWLYVAGALAVAGAYAFFVAWLD